MSEVNWEELLGEKKPSAPAMPPAPPAQPTQPPQPPAAPTTPPPPAAKPEKLPSAEELLKPKEEKAPTPPPGEVLTEEPGAPAKEVWLIFGDKGAGKTTTALSFPGEILALSLDRKSAIVRANMFNNDPRIHVFDVVKYMDYSSPEAMTASAEKTFELLNQILDNYTTRYPQPDWVLIDGSQILQQIAEWTMRKRHDIGPFDGISNLNLWKERRMYIRQIHNKALNLAKRGLIYTTYVEKDETVIKGEVVTRKDTPAWIDVLIYETDYVLYTYYDENSRAYRVKVVSSKNDKRVRSGSDIDVTNRFFGTQVRW
jgi:hypothetical protein